MNRKTLCVGLLAVVMFAAAARFAPAGDLNPPAGPIGPTMKPLEQIEPRVAISAANTPGAGDSLFAITQPGSYYLTSNVVGEAGKHGIRVTAAGVTIDLNGFAVLGAAGALDGINADNTPFGLGVRNGHIRLWPGDGLDAALSTDGAVIEGLHVSQNGGAGIRLRFGGLVRHCAVVQNGGAGIEAASGTLIAQCTSNNNGGDGIQAGNGATVIGCMVSGAANGISAGGGSSILDCAVDGTSLAGILAGISSGVRRCTVRNTSTDGIRISGDGVVADNNVDNAGVGAGVGAGVFVLGGENRVEGNKVSDSDTGVRVFGGGNLIVRNAARGNTTNYNIDAGNAFGPIVNVAGVGDVSATAGADHPWANFAF